MRRHDGIVKLVDFGLAKLQRAEPSSITIDPEAATREIVKTQPGTLLGTTHYNFPGVGPPQQEHRFRDAYLSSVHSPLSDAVFSKAYSKGSKLKLG